MTNDSNSDERMGWELIWRSENIPPRYRSAAAPNASVVEWADTLPPGGFVLDVGCGVGRHLVYLGGRGFRLAGVDVSPTGVRMSQEICAENQLTLDVHVSQMTHLPWPDSTFDGAFSTSTIHHNRRAAIIQTLDEIWRVLKPGGLLLTDFPCTDTMDYQHFRSQVASGQLREVEPNTFLDERPEIDETDDNYLPHHFSDEADQRDLLCTYDILRLWADLRDATIEGTPGIRGKWIAWARKPVAG